MKKTLLSLAFISLAYYSHAQVGVGTNDPKTTLDVVGKPADTTTPDGVTAPRVTYAQLSAKDAIYGADQTGTIVYVTAPIASGTPAGKTVNVTKIGYYYFDGAFWQKFTPDAAVQDLRFVGDKNHVTQDAGVGSNGTSLGTGSNNIAIGDYSQASKVSGNFNIGVGSYSLASNTTGNNNVAIGSDALMSSTTTIGNVAIGYKALTNTTTGNRNVAIGSDALSSNITSNENTAIGSGALLAYDEAIVSGGNTSLGNGSGMALTTGSQNTIVGNRALHLLVTGADNTAIGSDALTNSTVSNGNTAIGRLASLNLKGNNNTSLGLQALNNSYASNSGNTAIGYSSGQANSSVTGLTATNVTFLGSGSQIDGSLTTGTISNATAVGSGSVVSTSNTVILGRATATGNTDNVGIGVTAPTNALHVKAASNPVKLEGLVTDNTAPNLVVADGTGVLKTIPKSNFTSTDLTITNGTGATLTNVL